MQVSQEKLLQYIHFNRQYNTLLIEHNNELIEHNTELINQLKTEMETVKAINTVTQTSTQSVKATRQPVPQMEVESAHPQSGQSKQIYYHLLFSGQEL